MRNEIQRGICSALNMLTPQSVRDFSKIRVGDHRDGGYVMIDRLQPTGGVAYSLGVGPDTTWDVNMAERGWDIYQYDHTVEGAPNQHERCRFHKIGLAAQDEPGRFKRLDTLLRENGHEENSRHILKADIEGHEWRVFDALGEGFFGHFDQIVVEMHWLDHLHSRDFQATYVRTIGNIRRTHTPVHIHANNYAPLDVSTGIPIPPVVEVSFVKTAMFDFVQNKDTSPGPLDVANNISCPDIYLGTFSFPWSP